MKQFKLVDMRESYLSLIDEAESSGLGYKEFLVRLLEIEEDGKTCRRQGRLKKRACFEMEKTLENIDYRFNPALDRAKIEYLGKLDFIKTHKNVIIIGPPGVGKSMIATGIGINACQAGYKVFFVNAKDLIDIMYKKMGEGTLAEAIEQMNKFNLLIIDELSYLKMDKEKESIFYQIVRQRYEKSSLIITSNLPMGRWDEVFTGQLAATAILDRLVHHCHILTITGESYRVKGNIKEEQKNEHKV
jgi:DNA replication protein DnaC